MPYLCLNKFQRNSSALSNVTLLLATVGHTETHQYLYKSFVMIEHTFLSRYKKLNQFPICLCTHKHPYISILWNKIIHIQGHCCQYPLLMIVEESFFVLIDVAHWLWIYSLAGEQFVAMNTLRARFLCMPLQSV